MGQVLFAPALAGCTSDDVTASAAQVLSGYTALTKDSNDDPISGTMTNRGAWTSSSSGSGHIAIPAGYHNGSGYVDCSGAYNAGVTAADARANTSSANYKAGYNAGISAADGRVNTSSASYTSGYNAGISASKNTNPSAVSSVSYNSSGYASSVTLNNISSGSKYVLSIVDNNFNGRVSSISGASILISHQANMQRLFIIRATSSSVVINWNGGTIQHESSFYKID